MYDHEKQSKLLNYLLKQVFHEKDWKERAEAARQLGFLKDGRAVNLLCKALNSEKDPNVIMRIIEALGNIGDPKATMSIIEKSKQESEKAIVNKYFIINAIEALKKLKDKRALIFIGHYLNSEDEELRESAKNAFKVIEPLGIITCPYCNTKIDPDSKFCKECGKRLFF
ncbi:MAG: HEAT repeat domain-containing protein [Promethearchaeota archaeon]